MNYSETLKYLYHALPMFSRTGAKAVKPDLRNTEAICAYIGHPEKKIKTIHVAGTNGKGSVCNMFSAVLQGNGFKTGLYTSPHLKDFRERIRINGEMISQEYVVSFVEKTREFAETVRPSFFELTFAMAMDYFATEKVDIAVIETGLGGRLDSTNVIKPILSVITNIGYDHTDILGDTLEKIAFEKAGIIKQNVPVIIGETHPETKEVFIKTAKERRAPIVFADQNYRIINHETIDGRYALTIEELVSGKTQTITPDLTGIYQHKNLVTLMPGINLLRKKFELKEDLIRQALSEVCSLTGFSGRWQIIHHHPLIVMDVAHNADGIGQLVAQLAKTSYTKLHIVTGMVKDKDYTAVLDILPKTASYYFTNAHIPRALPVSNLVEKAALHRLKGEGFDDVNDAIEAARSHAGKDDLILICGSVFVIAEVDVNRWSIK